MKIKQLAEKHNDYMIEQRRYFHQIPELSLKETETTAAIAKELEKMGIEVTTFPDIPGCVGLLRGAKEGKTVLLRADIDALPVVEKTGLPFASKNEGVMHACGHDTHIAMQLGTAKILADLKDELPGNVKFYFQSAEEVAIGAKKGVEFGILNDVDACYGVHMWPAAPTGKFDFQSGERMASCDRFTITVKGTPAHGSEPQKGKDALVAASALVMSLQTITSRVNAPLNTFVLSIGAMNGGQRFNIVADKVELIGTIRTYSREFRAGIEEMIREMAASVTKAYGCTAELFYEYLTPPVINDNEDLVRIAQRAAKDMFGEDALATLEKTTGSEDYAFLMEKVPGIYGFVGTHNEEIEGTSYSIHHEKYTVDEKSLHGGAAVAAQFAYTVLTEGFNK